MDLVYVAVPLFYFLYKLAILDKYLINQFFKSMHVNVV